MHTVGIAGSVDFVGKLPSGEFIMLDWKRAKDLSSNLNSVYGKRANSPINHIHDCTASKYFLQLNLYRYVLRKYYGVDIKRMVLVSFHPNLEKYYMVESPIWDEEINLILEDHLKNSK
jgi:hypothetical protein